MTALRIKKPAKFNYSPGDWCFIKIPAIAIHEWHPFTISSAPEDPDHFSVHIRGVGHWTNKVYDHFKSTASKAVLADEESGGHLGSVKQLEVRIRSDWATLIGRDHSRLCSHWLIS